MGIRKQIKALIRDETRYYIKHDSYSASNDILRRLEDILKDNKKQKTTGDDICIDKTLSKISRDIHAATGLTPEWMVLGDKFCDELEARLKMENIYVLKKKS